MATLRYIVWEVQFELQILETESTALHEEGFFTALESYPGNCGLIFYHKIQEVNSDKAILQEGSRMCICLAIADPCQQKLTQVQLFHQTTLELFCWRPLWHHCDNLYRNEAAVCSSLPRTLLLHNALKSIWFDSNNIQPQSEARSHIA